MPLFKMELPGLEYHQLNPPDGGWLFYMAAKKQIIYR